MNRRIQLLISGRVQGVFFRASSQRIAVQLGLNGFVRNLPDGQVEVVAEGDRQALQKLTDWCRHGPAGANVENVTTSSSAFRDEFSSFEIR